MGGARRVHPQRGLRHSKHTLHHLSTGSDPGKRPFAERTSSSFVGADTVGRPKPYARGDLFRPKQLHRGTSSLEGVPRMPIIDPMHSFRRGSWLSVLLVTAFAVGACKGDTGEPGPEGPPGEPGEPGQPPDIGIEPAPFGLVGRVMEPNMLPVPAGRCTSFRQATSRSSRKRRSTSSHRAKTPPPSRSTSRSRTCSTRTGLAELVGLVGLAMSKRRSTSRACIGSRRCPRGVTSSFGRRPTTTRSICLAATAATCRSTRRLSSACRWTFA